MLMSAACVETNALQGEAKAAEKSLAEKTIGAAAWTTTSQSSASIARHPEEYLKILALPILGT
jgi:hypothetical protein